MRSVLGRKKLTAGMVQIRTWSGESIVFPDLYPLAITNYSRTKLQRNISARSLV
jgi:hypothetical protein